ncbi:MAG: restriction endonuclease [Coriobacteriia bacterium]|nr:restriction endonuclease [Coriobacteriia bacterium]
MEVPYSQLGTADLLVETIYKGGVGNLEEPIHHLFPKCGNMGGFRKVRRADGSGKLAYVILYTTMSELEWPDYLDSETGVFRYYGDNRKPGRELTDTHARGNALLEEVFTRLGDSEGRKDIPPFFIFKKVGAAGRDVQFLGMAAPGNSKISPDRDLVAFWRTMGDARFQNYEAYFTILDTGAVPISQQWLKSLIDDHDNNLEYAPLVWREFVNKGRDGIVALKAPRIVTIPSKYDQLQSDVQGMQCLKAIRGHYANNPYGFEACATNIISKMDNNFVDFTLTRPWRDGGRDAMGYYAIQPGGHANYPLKIDCALEAKCYAENNGVGVRQMSRLISRIRYRQFGIMVTTSYVDKQAYGEVVEDGHPILIVTASDIAAILRSNAVTPSNVGDWLKSVDGQRERY